MKWIIRMDYWYEDGYQTAGIIANLELELAAQRARMADRCLH